VFGPQPPYNFDDVANKRVITDPSRYVVIWTDILARVVRPNILCTNGIIHVIDTVLMHPDDVTVGYQSFSASPLTRTPPTTSVLLGLLVLVVATFFRSSGSSTWNPRL